ncbi:hypothetical protein DE146DRAFT_444647 [Phaeosphaeria sp. MPI-PUGE-AT-0046c]|nr:hypothetical protein DE146DRAFT_444647 [Phaeosphaeria sp. MPI-PUGE-AT-0046c]
MDMLEQLSLYDPVRHADILQMYDNIHGHYMMGYDRDGSEAYYLSRELEKLSKMLHRFYRHNPWAQRGFGDIASQLRCMGTEMLVGPRRRKHHQIGRPRYYEGGYYRGQRCGPFGRRRHR